MSSTVTRTFKPPLETLQEVREALDSIVQEHPTPQHTAVTFQITMAGKVKRVTAKTS